MKNVVYLWCIIGGLFSCNFTEKEQPDQVNLFSKNQKWQLVRISGGLTNFETTGDAMAWQEFYVFNPSLGSFLKKREEDGVVYEAEGTFKTVFYNNDAMEYIELTYNSGENLIESCTPKKEILVLRSINTLSNTAQACDGPSLDYRRIAD